jgi:hypothetical protein
VPRGDITERLRSQSVLERISATYELDRNVIASNDEIVVALRENLSSTNVDLVEITVMRLAIRAKDCSSFDQIEHIFSSSNDELVLSACAFGLISLAGCGANYRSRTLSLLADKLLRTVDPKLRGIYEEQIKNLRDN